MISISITCTDTGFRLTLTENGKHRKSYVSSNWARVCEKAVQWREGATQLAQLN